jgi:hypothetical protein
MGTREDHRAGFVLFFPEEAQQLGLFPADDVGSGRLGRGFLQAGNDVEVTRRQCDRRQFPAHVAEVGGQFEVARLGDTLC